MERARIKHDARKLDRPWFGLSRMTDVKTMIVSLCDRSIERGKGAQAGSIGVKATPKSRRLLKDEEGRGLGGR